MSSALDPIQLVRGPTEPQCHLRCGSCSTIHALDGRVRTGGIPCPSCGEQLRTSDTVEYATPRERLAAAILDGVLWVAPYAAVTAPLFYVVAIGEFLPEDEDGDLTSNAVLAMRSLGVILAIAYFWLLEAIGKTPGKLIIGLYVVRSPSWTSPGLGRGLVRLLGKALVLASLGSILLLTRRDPHRRAVHDFVSGTYVLRR